MTETNFKQTSMAATSNFDKTESSSVFSPLTDHLGGALSHRATQEAAKIAEMGKIKMINCIQKDPNAPPGTNKMTVKTMFDHGHNNRNKLLIYDDDPRIAVVMEQAHSRHEQSLKSHEDFLIKTHQKLQEQNHEYMRSSELKKQAIEKQKVEMVATLDVQLNHRVRILSTNDLTRIVQHLVKAEDKDQRRENYRTHFGPEPEDEEHKRNRLQEKTRKYKESIVNQIKDNQSQVKAKMHIERAFENLVVDATNEKIRQEEKNKLEKVTETKQQYKETWLQQIKVNQEKKEVVV